MTKGAPRRAAAAVKTGSDTDTEFAAMAAGGSLADRVHARLKKALNAGRYEPGEAIREEAVARWLQVSRTPVREALRRLAAENLLVSTSRGLAMPQLSDDQIAELYAIRGVLEGAAAGLAARHASAAEVELMQRLVEDQAAAGEDAARLLDINNDLHNCIYRAARNRYLLRTLTSLQNELEQLRGTTFSQPGRPAQALKEHRAMVRAIQRGDAEAAEKACREHVGQALKLRLLVMRKPPG